MTRQDFIEYLEANGCEVVRIANAGYHVMRNVETRRMSGIPTTDPPLAATVCRICKTLDVPSPKVASAAQALIDEIHDKFNGNSEN